MEIKIPIHKKQYYKAEDVDNLFVTINGVFKDVSAQAHRDQKALSLARQELQKAKDELEEKDALLSRVQSQNNQLEEHLSEMIVHVTSKDTEIESERLTELEQQILKLESRDRYLTAESKKDKATIESLTAQLEDKTSDYDRLLSSSAQRFDELETIIKDLKDNNIDNSTVDKLNNDIADLSSTNKSKDLIIGNLENEVDVLKSTIDDRDDKINELSEQLELLQYKFEQLQSLSEKRISKLMA